ncbi:MAG TPA: hypothetical protein VL985_05310 [Stellaceae bacterium]|nr:hypothetical protein [Stellaceae bacterium]
MHSFVETEIIAREARIDPELDATRAGQRLIAIGQALTLAGGDLNCNLSALDLLLEGAAVCSVAVSAERCFAMPGAAGSRRHHGR